MNTYTKIGNVITLDIGYSGILKFKKFFLFHPNCNGKTCILKTVDNVVIGKYIDLQPIEVNEVSLNGLIQFQIYDEDDTIISVDDYLMEDGNTAPLNLYYYFIKIYE